MVLAVLVCLALPRAARPAVSTSPADSAFSTPADSADTTGFFLYDADSTAEGDTVFEAAPGDFSFGEPTEEEHEDLEAAVRYPYPPYLHFNRVDQWALGSQVGFEPRGGWLPRYEVLVARAFNRDHRDLYVLEGAQPVLSQRRLLLGVELRRFTDHEDAERVGTVENQLAAFFFHYDYRDYFERDGISWFAEAAPWRPLWARLTYADHDYHSIDRLAPGTRSVFRRHATWRSNPPIDEGRMRSVLGTVVLDGRAEVEFAEGNRVATTHRGGWLRLRGEASGPGLSSDFTFTRYEAEARGYWPITSRMRAKARVQVGTTTSGRLPFQKEFAVGGISTLRAHPYKIHRGDQLFLANVEYAVQVWRGPPHARVPVNLQVVGFLDTGQAWKSSSYDLARRQMMNDAGLGLSLSDGRFSVYAARDLRDSDAKLQWTVRLANPF